MLDIEINTNEKIQVAKSSVIASLFLTAGKLTVGMMTGSLGILSEAAHSALDLFAALITYFAVKVSDKPADEEHPYGHAKIENFSALVEAILLLLTCIWIIKEAVNRLYFHNVTVEVNAWSFLIIIVSIVIDYSRARALSRVARKHNSQALEADALHFFSDIFSSFVVLGGLVFARLGIEAADPIAALTVAGIVIIASLRLAKKTVDALLDKAPEGLAKEITEEILKMPGVSEVHKVRLRQCGGRIQGDLHVVMGCNVSFVDGHKIASEVEKRLASYNSDIVVHFEPGVDYDESLNNIEETKKVITGVLNENASEINGYSELEIIHGPSGIIVGIHIVLPRGMSVEEARFRCNNLEQKITCELPGINVHFHIEPCESKCTECVDNCNKEQ